MTQQRNICQGILCSGCFILFQSYAVAALLSMSIQVNSSTSEARISADPDYSGRICTTLNRTPPYYPRCALVLHYAMFSDFYKSVTDRRSDGRRDRRTNQRTEGPTDGGTDTPFYRDARTHLKRLNNL